MTSSDEYKQALEEAYRRIGRNVVVFEQIELLLKSILNHGQIQGTASELKALLAKRAAEPDKRTLGQLIDPLVKHHLSGVDPDSLLPEAVSEVTLSMTVSFNHTAEERIAFESALKAMVTDRNDLIHTLLLRHRFDTPAGCRDAHEYLDQQLAMILPVRNKLRAMVLAMDDMKPDLLKALQEMARRHASTPAAD